MTIALRSFVLALMVSFILPVIGQDDQEGYAISLDSLKTIARSHIFTDPNLALTYCDSLRQLAELQKDTTFILDGISCRSTSLCMLGRFAEASELLFDLIKLAQKSRDTLELAVAHHNLGGIFHEQKELNKALQFSNKAIDLYSQLHDTVRLASSMLGQAILLHELVLQQGFDNSSRPELYEDAVNRNKESIRLFRTIRDTSGLAHALVTKAIFLYYDDQPLESLQILDELDGWKTDGYGHKEVDVLEIRAHCHEALGRDEVAEELLLKALSASQINYGGLKQQHILQDLYTFYANRGDENNFQRYHKRYQQVEDSLEKENVQERIKEIEMAYESEQLEAENELLQLQNQLLRQNQRRNTWTFILRTFGIIVLVFLLIRINRQKNRIEEQNTTLKRLVKSQNKLMAIVSHDLRSPLIGMSDLSQKVKNLFDSGDQVRLNKFINYLETTSTNLLTLVENLLNWVRREALELPVDRQPVDLHDIMQEVLGLHDNQLREKELKVHIDIPHDSLILVDKNSLQIVVRNVIDNAIKYSDRESQIRIVCYQKDQYLHCEISNQGDPIPPSLMAWINDENNIEVNALNNKSLGLYLAKDMMSRIDGDIEVVREVCVNFIKLHLPKVR